MFLKYPQSIVGCASPDIILPSLDICNPPISLSDINKSSLPSGCKCPQTVPPMPVVPPVVPAIVIKYHSHHSPLHHPRTILHYITAIHNEATPNNIIPTAVPRYSTIGSLAKLVKTATPEGLVVADVAIIVVVWVVGDIMPLVLSTPR